jgi:cytochrome P450
MIAAGDYDPRARIDPATGVPPIVACGPVMFSNRAQSWVVTRHEDCTRILREKTFTALDLGSNIERVLARAGLSMPYLQAFSETAFFGISGETHKRLRGMFARSISHAPPLTELIDRLTPSAHRRWQRGIDRGSLDIVAEYADPLIAEMVGLVLGIDDEYLPVFTRCFSGLTGIFNAGRSIGQYRETDQKLAFAAPLVVRQIEDRRSRPRQDCMTSFAAQAAEFGMSEASMVGTMAFLYVATSDQTSALVALAIRALLADSDALAAWQAPGCDDELAVQELFRAEATASYTVRTATMDAVIGDQPIRAGERAILLLNAANRDPDAFSAPARLDLGRSTNPHLAFSAGHHGCLGTRIAAASVATALVPLRQAAPIRVRTPSVEWQGFDLMRRMRGFEVEF